DEYLQLMSRFKREGIPFSTAVIDMDWHVTDVDPKYGSGWTGYTWNRDLFPDHRAFLRSLASEGLSATLNLHPRDGVRAFEEDYAQVARDMGIDPASGK
ncbi:glycoside hydrolase family 31 protein, partial [Klebsiella pneumoniae]|nr:glycoside hydrolase family 31 protein [Klebsiella pneumoniae]